MGYLCVPPARTFFGSFNARVRSPVRDWRSVKKVRNPGEGSSTRDKVLEWARTSSEIQR